MAHIAAAYVRHGERLYRPGETLPGDIPAADLARLVADCHATWVADEKPRERQGQQEPQGAQESKAQAKKKRGKSQCG